MEKCKKLLSHKTIQKGDIPDIPLYMDQVTDYMENILSSFKLDEDDKILTKTMINNYVKDKLINKPDKKKYTKAQIMELIMIYHFKNIISISELKNLFVAEKNLSENQEDAEIRKDIDNLYTIFSEIQKDVIKKSSDDFQSFINTEDSNDKYYRIKYILNLILQADINKRLAEIMIKEICENSL